MPELEFKVEINYVTDVSTSIVTNQEEHFAEDPSFKLIGKQAFIKLFKKACPKASIDPAAFWDHLFGNHSSGEIAGINPSVHYLTAQSCEQILSHYSLFLSGFDFKHLPAGFFITKNPEDAGICDVLHFSEFIAKNQKDISPLAITLSDKSLEAPPQFVSHFEGEQASWYQFLQGTRVAPDGTKFCTEQELQSAFIAFSNTIERLGLTFYKPDFSRFLNTSVNPIVLLGRWESVFTQRHLKKIDLELQWQVLPQLKLEKGSEAIRAITDYENDEHYCGFLLPLMELTEDHFDLSGKGFRSVEAFKDIQDEKDFWRFISYQPERNSIAFYQQAIEHVKKMDCSYNPYDQLKMFQILAASTTRANHSAKSSEDEQKDLATWAALCELIDTIEDSTTTLKAIAAMLQPGQFKSELTEHFYRLTEQPNIAFLDSIVKNITDYVKGLNILIAGPQIAMGGNPLNALVDLSNKLDRLINYHETHFYQGAKFYFQNDVWQTLNVQTYTELQYDLYQFHPNLSRLITPHLSTFNIQKINQDDPICHMNLMNSEQLTYFLDILLDIERNDSLTADDLVALIDHIQNEPEGEHKVFAILDYMNQTFGKYFKPHYFEEKKQQIIDAKSGLTQKQIDNIRKLRFLPEQEKCIIEMLSALMKRNPKMTDQDLASLSNQLVNLRYIILPEDFTLFTERLAGMKDAFPEDIKTFSQLLTIITKKRSLEDFNQIFARNKIEKVKDKHLLNKCIFFMMDIKPLTLDEIVVDRTALQEALATIALNTDFNSMGSSFTKKMRTLIKEINEIAKTHPHIQVYLIDCFNHIPDKNKASYLTHVVKCGNALAELCRILPAGVDSESKENMLVIYSLLAYYHKDPNDLTTLHKEVTRLPDVKAQQFLLTFISRLLDNGQSIQGLPDLEFSHFSLIRSP